jgi:MoxR-like ATPase
MDHWKIYTADGNGEEGAQPPWPEPPGWRQFSEGASSSKGTTFRPSDDVVTMVNVAIYLHRPLLVTGQPGSGKSSIAYSVAERLKLDLFHWPITTRTTLQDGLYRYDAIARLRDSQQNSPNASDIGDYITLGPLGQAFFDSKLERPSVLLIDELDKGDIDLPNDLLNIFEEGYFSIPELRREGKEVEEGRAEFRVYPSPSQQAKVRSGAAHEQKITLPSSTIRCQRFPIVIITSNKERDFPPAFLRRCLQLTVLPPQKDELLEIVRAHFGDEKFAESQEEWSGLVSDFLKARGTNNAILATDQLLNVIHMTLNGVQATEDIRKILWKSLSENE